MTRLQSIVLAGLPMLLAVSCERSNSTGPTPTESTPKGAVQIERVQGAEAVLAELGQRSWVFKHRGGQLTTEFTIYHRPEGKDQTQRVIFQAQGDDAVRILHSATGEDGKHDQDGGHIIVALPEPLEATGDVIHRFSLNGAASFKRTPAKEVFPNTVLSLRGRSYAGDGSSDKPVKLRAGETKALLDFTVSFSPGPEALDEREQVRFVLNVTGLNDGELPKRDDPGSNGELPYNQNPSA